MIATHSFPVEIKVATDLQVATGSGSTPAPMGWCCGCIRSNCTYTRMADVVPTPRCAPKGDTSPPRCSPGTPSGPSSGWRREPASDELANRRRTGFGMSNST
jgi:hypothetical protein